LQRDQHTCLPHDRHALSRNFNLNDPKRTTLLEEGEVDMPYIAISLIAINKD